jgi:multicomponent K+:H+ antiporter subunit A
MLLVVATLVLGYAPFWRYGAQAGSAPLTPADGVSVVAWVLLVLGALGAAATHRARLQALVLTGVVGLVVALAFIRLSAPDLALTQLSVEVVSIVLLLLALHYLPQHTPAESSFGRKARDGALAALAGLGAGGVTWLVLTRPLESISRFHLEQSVPGGGGTNVVNVILVDFRGYDTLGEITVLGIAALGIYLLLDGLCAAAPAGRAGRVWLPERHPLVLLTVTRILLPLTLLVAVYILLRGHNMPGGGFIAGLVVSVALIMHYLASGIRWTSARLHLDYHLTIAVGLLLATLTGVGSWLFGTPFLTSAFGHFHLPVLGEFELASAMLFDIGVFLTVIGAVMLILAGLGNLGYQERTATLRERRAARVAPPSGESAYGSAHR